MCKSNDKLKITITRQMDVTDCTSKFFGQGQFPRGYAIIEISEGCYGIADLKRSYCEKFFFKEISMIDDETYLLNLEDDTYVVVRLNNQGIYASDKFREEIKLFKKYILVNDLEGERKLVYLSTCYCLDEFHMWLRNGGVPGLNHAIMDLPNGKKTILLKDGLIATDIEFDSVSLKAENTHNSFRIVKDNDTGKKSVIRIADLKKSENFVNIRFVKPQEGLVASKSLVEVEMDDNKKSFMKIEDFTKSKEYDNVTQLSYEYAEVTNEEESKILRFSDFAEAQWTEK